MLKVLQKTISLKPLSSSLLPVRCKTFHSVKPRAPCWDFNQIQAGVKPKYAAPYDKDFPDFLKCRKQFEKQLSDLYFKKNEEHPYAKILSEELKPDVYESKMILILHANRMLLEDKRKLWIQCKKENMLFYSRTRLLMRMIMENTKYEPILQLYEPIVNTYLIISPEVKVHIAYKILKRFPSVLLMAGVLDDKLLRRHQLDELSTFTNIDEIRAQLLCTMGIVATQLVQNLSQHQMTTVAYLNKYVEMQQPPSKTEEPSTDENK